MSKKLLMNNSNNNNNETWDYEWYATSGELPTNDGSDLNAVSKEFIDDYLQIFINSPSAFIRFTPGDVLTSTNAILETMVCANALFAADNGIRVQVSNGTFGMQVKISSYDDYELKIDKFYKNDGSRRRLKYLKTNTFYKVRLELEGNTTRIYLDDELLDTSSVDQAGTDNDVSYAEGCYTTKHSIVFQDRLVKGSIKYIKFKQF